MLFRDLKSFVTVIIGLLKINRVYTFLKDIYTEFMQDDLQIL